MPGVRALQVGRGGDMAVLALLGGRPAQGGNYSSRESSSGSQSLAIAPYATSPMLGRISC